MSGAENCRPSPTNNKIILYQILQIKRAKLCKPAKILKKKDNTALQVYTEVVCVCRYICGLSQLLVLKTWPSIQKVTTQLVYNTLVIPVVYLYLICLFSDTLNTFYYWLYWCENQFNKKQAKWLLFETGVK